VLLLLLLLSKLLLLLVVVVQFLLFHVRTEGGFNGFHDLINSTLARKSAVAFVAMVVVVLFFLSQ